ncbi:hypothetical protein P43SY_007059 [Pythium insidiosum]|uniref:Uncharacterized protein n=1 Tax=Pythium insidiosum TaxID=114742 RepID=A0AAD5QDF7_PYTIN|nr:hypothetical protein P43SY_007059 [Pythium insidiosum]
MLNFALSCCVTPVSRDSCEPLSRLLELGLCDVWSAIRKDTARSVASILYSFPDLERVDEFIDTLIKIVTSDDWKASDGALLGLDALITRIDVEHIAKSASRDAQPCSVHELIKGPFSAQGPTTFFHLGKLHRKLPQLPRSLVSRLKPALYRSLQHDQVSVRETAAQCLAHFVAICDDSMRVLTFQEVISKLNRLSPTEFRDDIATEDDANAELLDSTEAEGLLDVLARLLPSLSIAFLVKHWAVIFPTLERYVVHIASSVRQRSSLVISALIELCQQRHQSRISAPRDSSSESEQPEMELLTNILLALARCEPARYSICWQRLEGRLLSIDVVVTRLGKELMLRHLGRDGACSTTPSRRRTQTPSVDCWLPFSVLPHASWSVLETDDEQRFCSNPKATVIEGVDAWLKKHRASAETQRFWEDVIRGWIEQTQHAFESTQFELRRISRQLLPGDGKTQQSALYCDWDDEGVKEEDPSSEKLTECRPSSEMNSSSKAWRFPLDGRADAVTIHLVELIERLSRPEDETDKHYGLFIWPSAMVLARFVAFHHERLFRDTVVLELGCGTALPGILAAKCGHPKKVLLSDRSDAAHVPSNVEANIALNGVQSVASFVALDWGDLGLVDHRDTLGQVDIILAADCFYQSRDFESVIATVAVVFRWNPRARFFTTYQLRSVSRSIAPLLERWRMAARLIDKQSFLGVCDDEIPGADSVYLYEITPRLESEMQH